MMFLAIAALLYVGTWVGLAVAAHLHDGEGGA